VPLTEGLSHTACRLRPVSVARRSVSARELVDLHEDRAYEVEHDTEGYHQKLNDDKHKMPFYLLVQKLRNETTDVVITATLVSDREVKRLQR